ncbi:MAG: hypothetical protein QXV69_07470 [Sulfolobaceae archaeon]
MRAGMILLLAGIILLLLAGIPSVLEFMAMQGLPVFIYFSPYTHWFSMIYGFFLILIGNELLIALSNEWARKVAPTSYVVSFGVVTVLANLANFLSLYPLQYCIVLIAFTILLLYSRIYLRYSSLGLRPTTYNYLLYITLIISSIIVISQIFFYNPKLGLGFGLHRIS